MNKKIISLLVASAFISSLTIDCIPSPKIFSNGKDTFDNSDCLRLHEKPSKNKDGRNGRDAIGLEDGKDGEAGLSSLFGRGGNGGNGGNG